MKSIKTILLVLAFSCPTKAFTYPKAVDQAIWTTFMLGGLSCIYAMRVNYELTKTVPRFLATNAAFIALLYAQAKYYYKNEVTDYKSFKTFMLSVKKNPSQHKLFLTSTAALITFDALVPFSAKMFKEPTT